MGTLQNALHGIFRDGASCPARAPRIFRGALEAGSVLLLLRVIGLTFVFLAPLAFPDWPSASFFSTSQIEDQPPVDFLRLYIPSNVFYA
jgi:hypothetical protein